MRYVLLAFMLSITTACTDAALWFANQSNDFDGVTIHRDLSYGNHPRQTIDIYETATPTQSNTLIAFMYGGGWSMGEKSQYAFVASRLTKLGYHVAVINYQLYPDALYPTYIEDTALAFDWLATNANQFQYNGNAIVAMGHSAGAYNVLMATTKQPMAAIRGVIGISGPYAFTPTAEKYKKIFAKADPIESMHVTPYLTSNMPPVLLLHGNDDSIVAIANSRTLAQRLNNLGVTHRFITYDDIGHYGIMLPFAGYKNDEIAIISEIDSFIQTLSTDEND